MKLSSIALVLAFAVNDAQADCTIPAQGTGAAITAATCVEAAATTVANDKTNCDGVTLLDTTAACSAIKVVAGATCAETSGTPVTADTAACAAITGAALGTSTACLSVDLSLTPGTAACTYTAGASAACTYTAGTTAAKTVTATIGGCSLGNSLAAGASCDLQMAATYAGAGTTTYTCPVGTCTEKVTALGVAGATVTADAAACAAVTALDSTTMCDLVILNGAGNAGAACDWATATQFTAKPTLAATGCAAGAYQDAGTTAATYTCAACADGKSYAAAAFGTAHTASPCTANCPANFYQTNNKLAACTKKVISDGVCAETGVTVKATTAVASGNDYILSAADFAKAQVGMKVASGTKITAVSARTISSLTVSTKTMTLSGNAATYPVALTDVITLTVAGDNTLCAAQTLFATSTACDAVLKTKGTCAEKATTTVPADVQLCTAASGGTKAACEAVRTTASAAAETGVSACTYTAPTASACTSTAATAPIAADVTLCAAVTQAQNTAAVTTCDAVKTTASATTAACDHTVAPTGTGLLTCAACVSGKTLAASTAILDSAQTAADCVAATTATTTASSAVSATASVATAVTAALAAAAVLV